MKAYLLFIFSLLTVAGYSQNSINDYKYVLVPARFDFCREDDEFGLNTTTKLLLEQKGFTAIVGNQGLPSAVAANNCNALKAEVVQRKALFSTNLTLVLRDCQGNVIFKSKEGKSREKELQPAFDLALRDAFASLKDVPYKYDSTGSAAAQQGAASLARSSTPAPASSVVGATPALSAVVPASASSAVGPAPASPAIAPALPAVADITGSLYAQAIPNGYQVIDTTPKKVLTLLKTSVEDYFIAEAGAANGIVFKKNGGWYFEYYKDNKLVSQKLEIKF